MGGIASPDRRRGNLIAVADAAQVLNTSRFLR
jgi:hypothetical protein